jgi:hypothetical protein
MNQEQVINSYCIIENYMQAELTKFHSVLTEALTPFIGKKILTNDGIVKKFINPEFTPDLTEELKSIGVNNINFRYFFKRMSKYSYVDLVFITGSNNSISINKTPYFKHNINMFHHDGDKLIDIIPFPPKPKLDPVTILNNLNKAETLKKELGAAITSLPYDVTDYYRLRNVY